MTEELAKPERERSSVGRFAADQLKRAGCRDHRSSIRPLGSGQRRDPAGRPHRLRRVGPGSPTVSIAALWLLRHGRWEDPREHVAEGRPRRRYYRLTEDGADRARAALARADRARRQPRYGLGIARPGIWGMSR